ncbi:uncharacterized protein LOC122383680 [Amphibalanus amphitrite]|uniref:uncharacterized protein LOC122383680 n=1 Tax=Amphibalanus amphitrite TaxID=1232801 RepID=UPI001C9245DE|nr:uncharacterized protein LOC122383680 [Amphibalanus amphitrite]
MPGVRLLVLWTSAVTAALAARDPRFFNVFSVTRFENSPCSTESGQGICTLPDGCGGDQRGPCAGGLGVCCVVEKSCRNTTSQKIAYFVNPNYPETDSADQLCDFRLEVTDPDICQVRLDFDEFETRGPETTGADAGTCDRSYLDLAGSGSDLQIGTDKLCGMLKGQHVYVHLNPMRRGTAHLSMMVRLEDQTTGAKWRIRATQVDCSERSDLIAPTGCTQYYNETKGTFESFNFAGNAYTLNQDYNICIGSAFGTCKTTFTSSSFQLDMVTASATSGVGMAACDVQTSGTGGLRSDYLFIPGGSQTGESPTNEKYCGSLLHYMTGKSTSEPVVTRAPGPLVVRFKTDEHFNEPREQGFRIDFEQSTTC